jgi:uncharacterized protein
MVPTMRLKAFDVGSGNHVVCNAITGKLVVMSDAGVRLLDGLRGGDAATCPPGVLGELARERLVFASRDEEERTFVRLCEAAWDDFRRNSPRHYTFVLNSHCNFNCSYCFEGAPKAPQMTLTREQIDSAFDVIDRYAAEQLAEGPQSIEIFGGEPLLPRSRPVLDHLLSRLSERGGAASIQTNGYHLSSYLDLFVRYQAHIGQVQVTLDGPRDVHDRRRAPKGGQPAFDRIVAGIDALLRLDLPIRVHIRMNVDRDNVSDLSAMAEVYGAHGWARDSRCNFVAAPVDNRCGTMRNADHLLPWSELFERVFPLSTDAGGGPFDLSVFKITTYFRHYLDVARRSAAGCPPEQPRFIPKVIYCEAAALKLFAFHPDGRIYPCPEAVGIEGLAVGTYHPKLSLDERRTAQWREQTILRRSRCRTCEIATFCGGGCVLTALLQNGTMAEPVCENAQEILELYFGQVRDAAR